MTSPADEAREALYSVSRQNAPGILYAIALRTRLPARNHRRPPSRLPTQGRRRTHTVHDELLIGKMEDADTAQYQTLRSKMEHEWLPQMQALLGLETSALPVIWDADFLYGPKPGAYKDTYVLCEVNVSAVWPFPPRPPKRWPPQQ
jgi:hypothetical protein